MQAIARLWGIFLLVCFIDAFRINISSGRCATRKIFQLQMASPKPPGISNTKDGKKTILDRTKDVVGNATMIMAIPVYGVTNDEMAKFKKLLPSGTKASMVKNTLLRKTVEVTKEFCGITADKVDHETVYLFMNEYADGKKTYDAYKKWREDVRRGDKMYDIKFAAFEGALYEGAIIERVLTLPTREQSMLQLIAMLKSGPRRLAQILHHVPDKLGKTLEILRQLKEKEEKEGAAPPAPAPLDAQVTSSPAA